MKPQVLILVLLFLSSPMFAWEADYRVKSMGISISDIHLELDNSQIRVHAKNREASLVAPRMDNHYHSRFNELQLPIIYDRDVNQSEDSGRVITRYDHDRGTAVMQGGRYSQAGSFGLETGTRDLFSFLAYLSISRPDRSASYVIDANSELWDLHLSKENRVRLRTASGSFDCDKYVITLQGRNSNKAPYVDMVTNNILNPDTRLTLWLASNGLIARAQVKRGISSMIWELVSFRP